MQARSTGKHSKNHIASTIELLNAMPSLPRDEDSGLIARVTARWGTCFIWTSAVSMLLLVMLAVVHLVEPLPDFGISAAMAMGVATQLFALMSLALQTVSGISSMFRYQQRIGKVWESECMHDHEMAARLESVPREALEAVDRWLELKIKRVERRQIRFFGGSEKLALFGVVAGAWSVWKETGTALASWQPSPLLFGVALFTGFALGGMVVARLLDRLAYQRDVLQIARSNCMSPSSGAIGIERVGMAASGP